MVGESEEADATGQDGSATVAAYGGSYTQVKVDGGFPTALPERELRRMAQALTFWSGYPVACALSVDGQAMDWCGWWLDHLALSPAHHLELQCVRPTVGPAAVADEP